VAWHSDQGYDLITIANPVTGEWRLEADVDPDNRVMIVTDLKLETSALPNRLAVDERVAFSAHLTNKGQVIDRRAFLDLVKSSASSEAQAGAETHPINDEGRDGDEHAGDGRFSMQFGSTSLRGEVALRVSTESATFVREKRFVVNIVAPASIELTGPTDQPSAQLTVDKTVVKRLNAATVYQEDPQGNRIPLASSASGENQWQAELHNAAWPVKADLEVTTVAGSLMQTTLGPVYVAGVAPLPVAAPESAEVVDEDVAPAQPEVPVEQSPVEDEETANWLMPAAIFGGVNVILIIGGGLAWWFIRRRKSDAVDEFVLVSDDESGEPDDRADETHEEAA
jgi:uncharacterized protein (TIGR03503 family)